MHRLALGHLENCSLETDISFHLCRGFGFDGFAKCIGQVIDILTESDRKFNKALVPHG